MWFRLSLEHEENGICFGWFLMLAGFFPKIVTVGFRFWTPPTTDFVRSSSSIILATQLRFSSYSVSLQA